MYLDARVPRYSPGVFVCLCDDRRMGHCSGGHRLHKYCSGYPAGLDALPHEKRNWAFAMDPFLCYDYQVVSMIFALFITPSRSLSIHTYMAGAVL